MITKKKGETPQQLPTSGRRWSFSNVVLDERSLELFVNGALTKIERKPLEVLIYLLQRAGEVVTKDELFEQVWNRRVFDDSTLTKAMSTLRTTLGPMGRECIATVHGFGYRMVAKLTTETPQPASPKPATHEPKVGDSPPGRPDWVFINRIGAGSHGTAWLAENVGTREPRVFKFAHDGKALTSYRREIVLHRLLADSLGQQAAVAQLLDWSLDSEPYFLGMEYVPGCDLASWASSKGGLGNVPLSVRLDMAAQVAEAVAAAHSVGVLHRDLKPGIILVDDSTNTPGTAPRLKLCDFGSGGITDSDNPDKLGETQANLLRADNSSAGTTAYVAPELLMKAPATRSSDVFSLGVLLYQLAVGDFRKTLAPGWEATIEDEVLRDDIALSAAGDPEKRLGDAGTLATMLRTIDERRVARLAAIVERDRSVKAQRAFEQLRRARVYIAALVVLFVAAIASALLANSARNQAIYATETGQSINAYLTDDVLGIDPTDERPSQASYESLLARAAASVDLRFRDNPEASAKLHLIWGRRYQEMGNVPAAIPEFERSAHLFETLKSQSPDAIAAREELATAYFDRGRTGDALKIFDALVTYCGDRFGLLNPATQLLRIKVARAHAISGDFRDGEAALRLAAADAQNALPLTPETQLLFKDWIGVTLSNDVSSVTDAHAVRSLLRAHANGTLAGYLTDFASEYSEAEALFRSALSDFSAVLGDGGELTALGRLGLASALTELQRFSEAEALIHKTSSFLKSWLPPNHWLQAAPVTAMAIIRYEQGARKEGILMLEESINFCVTHGCSPRIVAEIEFDLAVALQRDGQLGRAEGLLRKSLAASESLRGPSHVESLSRRIALADLLLERSKATEAAAVLAAIEASALAALPRPDHLVVADLNRVKAAFARKNKQDSLSKEFLEQGAVIYRKRLGMDHWKTRRILRDLEQLPDAP